jgi:hypothetical protein
MTTTNALSRQPTKLDLASPAQFKFSIIKLPKVEYFCTAANIPGVSLSSIKQMTPLADIPIPGEKIDFENLECTFMVDENLENYREIHGWLMGLGFPASRTQFRDIVASGSDRFPLQGSSQTNTDPGKVTGGPVPLGPVFSDATLNVLSSKNRANIEVRFSDVFPVSLSGLSFNQQGMDVDYLSATVTFQYKIYEFAVKGGKTSTIVT